MPRIFNKLVSSHIYKNISNVSNFNIKKYNFFVIKLIFCLIKTKLFQIHFNTFISQRNRTPKKRSPDIIRAFYQTPKIKLIPKAYHISADPLKRNCCVGQISIKHRQTSHDIPCLAVLLRGTIEFVSRSLKITKQVNVIEPKQKQKNTRKSDNSFIFHRNLRVIKVRTLSQRVFTWLSVSCLQSFNCSIHWSSSLSDAFSSIVWVCKCSLIIIYTKHM